MKTRVAVIGGGASGLTAAITAAREGAEVTLLERGHLLGRKILASGAGRCNLTNSKILPEHYHCGQKNFVKEALARFKAREILAFFSNLGLLTVEEPDGRIFPRCDKAAAVLDVLKAELERLSVKVLLLTDAAAIRPIKEGFLVQTQPGPAPWQKTQADPQSAGEFRFDRVILACGGTSYPALGAGEKAYDLAKSLGHSVTPPSPALVPLCVKDHAWKHLQGLRLQAAIQVFSQGRVISRSQGEVLFTDYGLSGPVVLDVSREAVLALRQGAVQGSLNLFPEFSPPGLKSMLLARWAAKAQRPLKDFFLGIFPSQLAGAINDTLGIDSSRTLDSLGNDVLTRLISLVSDWRFEISGARPWSEAMATAGGVDTLEVDPKTFESRKVPGLFLTGEMLDVDGDSGGFNLHFAWASGLSAGAAAAKYGKYEKA